MEQRQVQRLMKNYRASQIKGAALDRLLSDGFFRSSATMNRVNLLVLGGKPDTVIQIRVPLSDYVYKKRHRRMLRRVRERFRVVVQPFELTAQKDALYQSHKHRFRGYLQDTLFNYINGEQSKKARNIFESYEVSVYDGERLIAFSLFDVGNTALASILCVFDKDYAEFSLGIFTMLQEISFGMDNGFLHYYPGYVLHDSDLFGYKLTVSTKMEFLHPSNEWRDFAHIGEVNLISEHIFRKIEAAELMLDTLLLPYKRIVYANFGAAYYNFEVYNYVRAPVFLLLWEDEIEDGSMILEYWYETNMFMLSKVEIYDLPESGDKLSEEERDNFNDLLSYTDLLAQHEDPFTLLMYYLSKQGDEETDE
jgi:leucyl-tRNA---protein transferase